MADVLRSNASLCQTLGQIVAGGAEHVSWASIDKHGSTRKFDNKGIEIGADRISASLLEQFFYMLFVGTGKEFGAKLEFAIGYGDDFMRAD